MEECAKGGVGLCSVEDTLGPKAAPGDFLKAVRLECGLEGWGGSGRGVGEKRKESDAQGRGAQRVKVVVLAQWETSGSGGHLPPLR